MSMADITHPDDLTESLARREPLLAGENRFFQIESLLRFNEQLHPTWEPRFIYHEGVSALPRVALAYLEAESFLRVPLVGSRAELRRRLTQPEGHVLVEPI